MTTTAIVPDRSVSELRSYIKQLKDFRQKHNFSGMYLLCKEINLNLVILTFQLIKIGFVDDSLDSNKSSQELHEIFQNELNILLSETEGLINESTYKLSLMSRKLATNENILVTIDDTYRIKTVVSLLLHMLKFIFSSFRDQQSYIDIIFFYLSGTTRSEERPSAGMFHRVLMFLMMYLLFLVSVQEVDETKEPSHLSLPTTVSEALLKRSDSSSSSTASKLMEPSKVLFI